MWYEERVNPRSNTENPTFSLCCQQGTVRLPPMRPTPAFLDQLLDYRSGRAAAYFRDKIRIFNSMYQISSMGARVNNSINNTPGPYVFRINGQNHHRIGSLLPAVGQQPKFGQLYIYDTEHETSNRLGIFEQDEHEHGFNRLIVEGLKSMLDECNAVVRAFRMARDRSVSSPDVPFRLILFGDKDRQNLQYDRPSNSEVAALVVGDLGDSDARDIIVEHRANGLQWISELHHLFISMQYPLLFPHGDSGFTLNIPYADSPCRKREKRSCVTMREYYAHIIQMRNVRQNTLLRAGRLFQQFLTDAFCVVEESRLRYIRANQQTLRCELYSGLRDALNRGDTNGSSVGKRIILPASFTGSPRYMFQNYQDAMAICRYYGFPDLFITFTCNARWTEIQQALSIVDGQRSEDKPDAMTRVFKLKLRCLMHDIVKKQHFGQVVAATYTVEFQKRGLPHIHLLIWLHPDDKCKNSSDVDRIISAEIPNPKVDKVGYDAVTEYMMHGPCGVANLSSPCMRGDRCSKYFPKSYVPETKLSEDSFPIYRRRDTTKEGCKVIKNGIELDNRFVVPHNVDLVVKYEAHINVELCCKSRVIKYLFKYINKGPDRSRAILQASDPDNADEISIYLDCRYVSPYEACWRLFAFDIHHREPSVERLSVHLPDEQHVCFGETQPLRSVMGRTNIRNTMFIEWMRTNRLNEDARTLLYADFPTQWVWTARNATWTRRKRGKTIGRISFVHPAAGELYYLRMAVTKIKGATCYEDLRTVDGIVYPTYRQACQALGLLGDDREWTDTFLQASEWASSKQLRNLFAIIIMYCEVGNPLTLDG